MRVAAIQMTSTPNKGQNLAEAHHWIREAANRGAELVALPENFSLITDNTKHFLEESEPLNGLTVQTLQEWAAEYDLWILAGSLPIKPTKTSKRVTNTSLLINAEGVIKARYDKIHLFDANLSKDRAYTESKTVKAGSKIVTAKTPWGKVGLSVCYDLRFPELYRGLSKQGADILFIPAAFTSYTGRAHWDVLTRARAIENQCFVIAPAQTGEPHPGRTVHGHTRIIDPWGRIIAERPAGTGMVYAELNFDELKRIRTELPALKHRKLG